MSNREEHATTSVQGDQRRQLVERILASSHFVKSPRLSAFLSYICEQDRLGRAHQINEQRIGVAVFGRPDGYSVGDDSIVRSQARFLRQKLEEYFAQEGLQEPIVLFIPKGSYQPAFHAREEAQPLPATEPAPQASSIRLSERLVGKLSRHPRLTLAVTALLLALVLTFLIFHESLHLLITNDNAEERFWSTIFDAKRTPIIVPSDSSLVLLQNLGNRTIPLQDYMTRRYVSTPPTPEMSGLWQNLTTSQYTNLADLNLAFRLGQLPQAANAHARIRYARSLALKELKENNAILIGGVRSNPWVELYSPWLHTDVTYDQKLQENFVWNHNPAAGEQERYYETSNDGPHTAYGLIARVSSLDGQGAALLVGGTSKAGTEAAAEFLFSKNFAEFLHRFDDSKVTPHFEILISTENLNGESSDGHIVYFHILN